MIRGRPNCGCGCKHARAFSLAETAICILLVSGMLVAALDTLGSSSGAQRILAERSTAHLLARDLMAEITGRSYEDPDGSPVFGIEVGEASATRSDFDDVDDYASWTSTPPEQADGTSILASDAFARSATVEWVLTNDALTASPSPTNVKRITVTVTQADDSTHVLAELVALRTAGPPPPNDLPVVLFVVADPTNLTPPESERVTLIESWGFSVALIAASAPQSEFDDAVANAVAAYVPALDATDLVGTKLRDAPIGVVNADAELLDDFGFCEGAFYTNSDELYVSGDSHYITTGLTLGWSKIYTEIQPVFLVSGSVSPSMVFLAGTGINGGPTPYVSTGLIETGGMLYGGGTTPARRVQLPWGASGFDLDSLNADAEGMLRRSIEWAAELDTAP